ncbi:MAG: cytochrome C oxidase subunit I [Hyphomonadaceae bacterium]
MQNVTLIISLVLMLAVGLVFFRAVRAVDSDTPLTDVETKRSRLIWGMMIVGVIVTLGSLRDWPHAIPTSGDIVQVNATGGLWYWEIDTTEVPLGKTVVFNLTTTDVNHGFGVVDEEGTLLLQTQAMPGYTNKVKYVFDKPGEYRVICMEFCGIGHHAMVNEFEVLAELEG